MATYYSTNHADLSVDAMIKLGLDPHDINYKLYSRWDAIYRRFIVSAEKKKEFTTNPEKLLEFRKVIEISGNTIHSVTFRGSEMQTEAIEAFRIIMAERLSKKPDVFL